MSNPIERTVPAHTENVPSFAEATVRPGEETAVAGFTAEQRDKVFGLLGIENNIGLVIRQGIVNKDVDWETVCTAFLQSSNRAEFLRRLFQSGYPLNKFHLGNIFQAVEGEAGEAAAVLCEWMLKSGDTKETERLFSSMARTNPKICGLLADAVEKQLASSTLAEVLEIMSNREVRGNFPLHVQRAIFVTLSRHDAYPVEGLLRLMRYEGMQNMLISEKHLPVLANQLASGTLKVENGVLNNLFTELLHSKHIATDTILEITARHGLLKRILWPEWRIQELRSILKS